MHAFTPSRTATRLAALALAGVVTFAFFDVRAQALPQIEQRDVHQQQRIRDGLQDGRLTPGEAARLENEEAQVDRLQAHDLHDGHLRPAERRQIDRAQDRASRDIARAERNRATDNPQSASSQRMQHAVQRDINQQQRILDGTRDGQLTNREVGRLEAGQAHVDAKTARAARDGHLSAADALHIDHAQDVQSAHIHQLRHNARVRG